MSAAKWKARKVVVIGAGAVGSTFAYALAQSGLADEIALLDANADFMKGQVLDLAHGQPFFPSVHIHEGAASDYADADLIVVTAGSKQAPGESRLELLQRNAQIIRRIVDEVQAQNSSAVLLMVSNPVDILTHVAQRHSGWPRGRVLGSGTVLDSGRFRYLLSRHCGVDVHNVHAYMLGEHGDSEFAAWSMTNMAGVPIREYCQRCRQCAQGDRELGRIEQEVRQSAYHIIGYKGATWFAVGLALVRIAEAILRNQRSVLTVSAELQGEYGLRGITLGIPCIVGQRGVEKILEMELPPEEQTALAHSAEVLRQAITALGM